MSIDPIQTPRNMMANKCHACFSDEKTYGLDELIEVSLINHESVFKERGACPPMKVVLSESVYWIVGL